MKTKTYLVPALLILQCLSVLHAASFGPTFTTTGALATDTASWNYTLDASYAGSGDPGTDSNMFIARGESSISDHSIETILGESAYYLRTVNTQNTNFGFYLMNLDFTSAPGEQAQVDYSFKILGNDTNNSINPADWHVRYTNGTSTVGVSAYTELDQTFSFLDDSSAWTTVSGSFTIDAIDGTNRGALLINSGTSGSLYTSGGGYYLSDYTVEVSAIPEPSTLLLMVGGFLTFITYTKISRNIKKSSL